MGIIFLGFVVAVGITIYAITAKDKQDKPVRLEDLTISMQDLKIIERAELPTTVVFNLIEEENVYYFSYLCFKDEGCFGGGSRSDYWICLTDKRILYKAQTKDSTDNKLSEKQGFIPFEKISFIEVVKADSNEGCGCSGSTYYELRVGSSGGQVIIPIPTEMKGYEIRKIYTLVSNKKEDSKNDAD